jgi:hypothetical protein
VDRDVQDLQGGGLMEKRHDYIKEQQDYCSEGDRCRIQIYEESGNSSLEHPRMRRNAGRLGGTSPNRYSTRLRGEDDEEAG